MVLVTRLLDLATEVVRDFLSSFRPLYNRIFGLSTPQPTQDIHHKKTDQNKRTDQLMKLGKGLALIRLNATLHSQNAGFDANQYGTGFSCFSAYHELFMAQWFKKNETDALDQAAKNYSPVELEMIEKIAREEEASVRENGKSIYLR